MMNTTNRPTWIAAVASTALCTAGTLAATVTTFGTYGAWSAAAGDVTTITFGEVPLGTLVTDEYEPLGVLFTDSNGNWTTGVDTFLFPQDGYGLDGEETIELTLLTPAIGVAAHFPGGARFRLYSGDSLIYESPYFGGSGVGKFGGMISTVAFDRVVIFDQIQFSDQVFLDNLYLSFAPVPAPGAGLLLAVGLAMPARRRGTCGPRVRRAPDGRGERPSGANAAGAGLTLLPSVDMLQRGRTRSGPSCQASWGCRH